MQANIIRRIVTAARAHFVNLLHSRSGNSDARSDSSTVALGSDQMEEHAMVRIVRLIDEQRGRPICVEHDKVQLAVVVDVANRRTSARMEWWSVEPGIVRDLLERPVSQIAKELNRFGKPGLAGKRVH